MIRPWHLALALVVGWAIGSLWPTPAPAAYGELAELRGMCVEEIRAAETRGEQRDIILRAEIESAIEQRDSAARIRAGDLFCLATHPRGMAPAGFRYASEWGWLSCRERY